MYLISICLPTINFKNKLSKTITLEIYVYENNQYIMQKKIDEQEIINEFIKIFSTIKLENKPMMTTPITKYKLIFYNSEGKKISEIKCLPNVIISDLYGYLKLGKDKLSSLENLIGTIINK